MNESHFTILSTTQKIRVSPSDLYPSYDGLQATLGIPVNFTLNPPNRDNSFDLVSLEAKLRLIDPTVQISQTVIQPAFSSRPNTWEGGKMLNFIISEKAIHLIEKNRKGELHFGIEFTLLILVRKNYQPSIDLYFSAHDFWTTDISNVTFYVPRSVWIEKILPKFGYRNLKLFEIPLSHNLLKEAYGDIIFEFDKAEQYFNAHDYNKCVAHCRNTLDALHRNLLKIKKQEKVETSFNWMETISTETLKWVTEIDKANFSLASKSHHVGHKKDFKRFEAEAIYLIVLGLLNYVGNVNE